MRSSALPPPPHSDGRPLVGRLTVAAAHGGQKGSSLPALFEMVVNRRYAREEAFDDVLAELQDTVREAMAGSKATVRTRLLGHFAPTCDPTGPHWPRWQAALSLGFGFGPEDFRAWGSSTSSDMGWVQRAGVREILLGGLARPGSNVHGADEHTTIEDVMALARTILVYLASKFAPDLLPETAARSAP